ncbi:SprT family zinc-dependent metalloprotease [Proteiniborus sp.]|uniref:M48 family metallopeptidase n=1 Tax=Proteiniborus sp. TaxID=2079015 RepID=UPI00332E2AF2
MKMKFKYEAQIIEFTVEYRKRKTLEIRIEPPDNISVIAPKRASEKDILRMVETKANWIVKKLSELKEIEKLKKNKEYVNGESFMYLGRYYSLEIIIDETVSKPITKLYQGKFYITTNTRDQDNLKESMKKWYYDKSLEKILERVEHFQSYFSVKPNSIKVKEQKKRWGSCTSRRDILINWRISMAPADVLDYLVVHEMCHMVQMNHSSDFWKLVERIMPDYKRRRDWLRKYGIMLNL